MLRNLVPLFVVFVCQICVTFAGDEFALPITSTDSGTQHLFDINSDPYEDVDVVNDAKYADALAYLEERRLYWKDLTIAEHASDGPTSLVTPVKAEDSGTPSGSDKFGLVTEGDSIKQIYDYEDAPNIVYVLIDDWGYNDFGARSTYMSWTTPTLNRLASEGVLFESYYTSEVCGPSRGSLLTGRYALRLGIVETSDSLPLTETTLAEELQTAGYRSYIIGKWHLGKTSDSYLPTNRGFNYFYGYLDGYQSYWTKKYEGSVDMYENLGVVTSERDLDDTYHSAYLFQHKAEEVIKYHASSFPDEPMFLYYPMQLIHYPWTAPEIYLERCTTNVDTFYMDASTQYDVLLMEPNYCAMNLMMDEAIANLTCTLDTYGFSDNTILIIAGDNGGVSDMSGNNYPLKGYKDTAMRGAFANTAIMHSKLIPDSVRGTTYNYDVHITDWYPTIMGLATNSEWTGSYTGADIDGVDIWSSVMEGVPSSRNEIVFASKPSAFSNAYVAQYNGVKYIYNINVTAVQEPDIYFDSDLDSSLRYTSCPDASLLAASYAPPLIQLATYVFGRSTVDAYPRMSVAFLIVVAMTSLAIFAKALSMMLYDTKRYSSYNAMNKASYHASAAVGRESEPLIHHSI